MKRHLWMALVSLLMLGSCSQEEWQNQVPAEGAKDLIVASFEGKGSRASVLEKSLVWGTGDKIAVMGEDGTVSPFTLLPEYNGKTTGEFVGVMPENPKVAVFPYISEENAPRLSGNSLIMTLPNEITETGQCNLPMWSSWNGKDIYFKHLVGLLAVSVNDIPVGYNSLKLTASKVIAGTFAALDITKDEVILTAENGDEANKTVTVHFDEVVANAGNEDNDRLVYIPLPVGTYANIKVSLSNGTHELELKTWTNKEVKRAKIYSASLTYVVVEATTTGGLTNALEEAFKTEDTTGKVTAPEEPIQVKVVGEEIKIEEPIVVPAAEDGKTSDISINFSVTPTTEEGTPLVIEQNMTENAVAQESANNLTINMPAPENDSDKIEHVVINTPTTTTTLNGGSYTNMTALTAINTLVLGEGTVIENLIIGGGNIRLQGGQITTTLDVSPELKEKIKAGNDKIFIIMENSASYSDLPAGFTNNDYFQIVDAEEYDFRQAIAKGGDVVMSAYVKPMIPFESFEIVKSTTIDLNGQGIHVSANAMFKVLPGVELTLMDSYPNSNNSVENGSGVIILNEGGVVNIKSGKYRGTIATVVEGSVTITGGRFTVDPSEYVPEGYVVVENNNNGVISYTVHEAVIIENEAFSKGLMTTAQLQGKIELNENGYAVIAKPDAETVTEISMNNVEGGIAVVDHLEMFPNLQTLSCTYCGVQEIVIPENNVLKSLNLNDNSLTNLDLSHATGLTFLSCRSNNLTTLDLSKLTALNTLFCYGNKLDELDLTMHSALTNLLCGAQQDGKTLILKLSEEMKDKWNNDFYNYGENSNVDLEGQVIIRNAEFSAGLMTTPQLQGKITLNAQGYAVISKADADAVTEIDIWEYDKITKIDQLEKFPNLVTFKCMYCKVEEAHLSHQNIENIHIRWNNLKKLDLTGLPKLNWITANSNQITEVVIPDNSQITQLDISQNQLTAISIPENNNLSSLGIADNALTTLDLNNCTKMTSLTCGNNNLTQLDVSMLTDLNSVWCQGNRLEELDLSKNKWVFSLNCGNQQENKTLYLKLPDELLDKWESSWKGTANFTNVELYTPKVEEGSGSTGGDNFNGVIL